MESVRAAKRLFIHSLEFSDLREPGVLGAALFAGKAAAVRSGAGPRTRQLPSRHAVPVSSGGKP